MDEQRRIARQVGHRADGRGGPDTPPVDFRRKADEAGISPSQAAALIAAEYGIECDADDVTKVMRDTGQEKRWTHWFLSPRMVAIAAGGIMQRRAGWWQKRLVHGDVMAEVEGLVEGKVVLMSVPMRHIDEPGKGTVSVELEESIVCREWPTGIVTGRLDLDPDQEQYEMTPRYIYTRTGA